MPSRISEGEKAPALEGKTPRQGQLALLSIAIPFVGDIFRSDRAEIERHR